MIRYVVTYDIADDRRREDVATLLSGYGPRVRLSVFECDLRTRREAAALRSKLRELIDPVEIRSGCTPRRPRGPAGSRDRRSGHRGTPGLLDRDMTWYGGCVEQSFSGAVGAREPSGQYPAVLDSSQSRPPEPPSPNGWRRDPQNARSRGPPQRVCHKAQPETEGIETAERLAAHHDPAGVSQSPARNRGHRNFYSTAFSNYLIIGHKAQPETEGIETCGWPPAGSSRSRRSQSPARAP